MKRYNRCFTDSQEEEICNLYFKNKMSQRDIAKQMGCSQGTIGYIIRKKGLRARNHSECQRGEKNPFWRGGRLINSRGYIIVFKPSHPHSTASGYVREHRLVMERYLERYLKPEEVVHHTNKDKIDNRIENIVLFKNVGAHTKWHRRQSKP